METGAWLMVGILAGGFFVGLWYILIRGDAELDMRFDVSEGKPTAWDLLQVISRDTLARTTLPINGTLEALSATSADNVTSYGGLVGYCVQHSACTSLG